MTANNSGEFLQQKYETAPKFLERRQADRIHIAEIRKDERPEDWSIGVGDYFSPFSDKQKLVFPPRKDTSELLGTEITLYEAMKKIIDRRTHDKVADPAIFLDFGGMWGTTWGRLANKFKNEVEDGKVCFVVSNIQLNPKLSLPDSESFNEGTIDAVNKYRHLVNFIQCDANELSGIKIMLPNGNVISLNNHLALIHEKMALTHGSIPDTDLPTLAENLEEGGILMFASDTMHTNIPERNLLQDEINKAFVVGKKNLQKLGYKDQNIRNECGYKIYSKKESRLLFV
ncbi:MAG TPA: hypothetical protein VG895_04810 [Patescibacteria group bacterium]|nr:hypothetical protein [Patescibacteria group bacterium]